MWECMYCGRPTKSKYWLCRNHLTMQYKRLKKWIIKDITEYKKIKEIKKEYKKWLLKITMPQARWQTIIINNSNHETTNN